MSSITEFNKIPPAATNSTRPPSMLHSSMLHTSRLAKVVLLALSLFARISEAKDTCNCTDLDGRLGKLDVEYGQRKPWDTIRLVVLILTLIVPVTVIFIDSLRLESKVSKVKRIMGKQTAGKNSV